MLRYTRSFAGSLAVLLVAGVLAPVTANAWSLGKKTKTDASSAQSAGTGISVQVYNRGQTPQGIKVDGQLYTVQPHQTITLKAAPGTDVYANTAGNGYQEGELLFRLQSAMNGATVKFN
jgi:hypothetical protein